MPFHILICPFPVAYDADERSTSIIPIFLPHFPSVSLLTRVFHVATPLHITIIGARPSVVSTSISCAVIFHEKVLIALFQKSRGNVSHSQTTFPPQIATSH